MNRVHKELYKVKKKSQRIIQIKKFKDLYLKNHEGL